MSDRSSDQAAGGQARAAGRQAAGLPSRWWQGSVVVRAGSWYRQVWGAQPFRHSGLILLAAVMVMHLPRSRWTSWSWEEALLVGLACAGVWCGQDAATASRESRLLRWLARRKRED